MISGWEKSAAIRDLENSAVTEKSCESFLTFSRSTYDSEKFDAWAVDHALALAVALGAI